jgi:DNA polymerase III, delta subunit
MVPKAACCQGLIIWFVDIWELWCHNYNMFQTNLFLTQTYLNLDKLQKQLAHSFFMSQKMEFALSVTDIEIEENWHTYLSQNQITTWNGESAETESKKEAFKKFISNEVYIQYNKPTLLFLGDLTTYSDVLQEGMLKLLEEPPINLYIVLFAQNLSQIKPTIISRSNVRLLNDKIIFTNLDARLLEKVKKLPEPKVVVNLLINNKKVEIEKVADFERDELDFWMWQIQTNLTMIYAIEPETQIAEAITRTLKARQLNSQNLQKKFAVGQLNLNKLSTNNQL